MIKKRPFFCTNFYWSCGREELSTFFLVSGLGMAASLDAQSKSEWTLGWIGLDGGRQDEWYLQVWGIWVKVLAVSSTRWQALDAPPAYKIQRKQTSKTVPVLFISIITILEITFVNGLVYILLFTCAHIYTYLCFFFLQKYTEYSFSFWLNVKKENSWFQSWLLF